MKQEVKDMLGMLYPMEKAESREKRFERGRRTKVLTAGLLLAAVLLPPAISGTKGAVLEAYRITRPEKGSSEVLLTVDSGTYSAQIPLEVGAKVRTGGELEELFSEAFEELEKRMQGKNSSLSEVEYSLVLPDALPELGVEIYWETSDSTLLQPDGSVCNHELEKPAGIVLGATVVYAGESRKRSYPVTILPYPYSGQELFEREVLRAVGESSERTSELDYMELPQSVSSGELYWEEAGRSGASGLLLLWVVLLLLLYFHETSELLGRMKKREGQLLADYPDFLSRFLLLLGAGMNVRGAWERMTEDYKKNGRCRYVYEEMKRTAAQLEVGMPELQAYEIFGRRCGLLPYLRFTAILSQNLRKGSRGIAELLQSEAREVFSERMAQARRKGEEAGTRLLLPMGGMLVLVLVVILVPAFASFAL
ncbi:MAG: type II secretion system F family protein [Lachnospiraceae bacterium]|nr:type II secretion system F family protein [Lachnospiraceae bacterium]